MKQAQDLLIKQMEVGPMGNYVYFLGDAKTKEVAVVDPAWDVDFICNAAAQEGWKISAILLTHGHPDHTNGLNDLLSKQDVPAYISKFEASFFKPRHKNIRETEDHEKIKIGNIEIECLLTPGHTPGCQCYKTGEILVTGDTLFIDGCGRVDLPGGNARVMYNTLYNIILKLPESTMIYPGHHYGDAAFATLRSQKKTNPYLLCSSMEEFLQERMGLSF
ncbi:MAG TPA: hypothetical protein DD723_00540 [Candidatus Omnitrophica bacterium]|nr:MAG: hypothetical protein A2Z81_09565 [Omnitrophica WOR_2 bacterium GWA2_45_18]HBR14019.1 hypothetical protein [Candidatus Omnitrophota bacterium]